MIFITFERRDKTRSKIEKTWFLLVLWVAKNSKPNKKNPEAVVQRCFVKKEFLKFSLNCQENTSVGGSF